MSAPLAVCALTYQRPQGLERLLAGLAAQRFAGAPLAFRVVIVDNSADASAAAPCAAWNPRLAGRLVYVHEPRPGIAVARNAALAAVAGTVEWIAFLDDDEVPEPDWLDRLLAAQRGHAADVVTGPVLPHFESPPPQWVLAGGFFAPEQRPTGTSLEVAYTHNVLFRAEPVERLGLRFDERLNLMGGEDTLFFRSLRRAGLRMVWADDARVREWIPAARLTRRWLVRRMVRYGVADGFIALELAPGWATRWALWRKGAWIMLGSPRWLLRRRPWRWVQGLRKAGYGWGLVRGATGGVLEEYARRPR